MALRSCAATSVAAAVLACTPNPGAPAIAEHGVADDVVPAALDGRRLETRCGGLEIFPQGPWTAGDPRLAWVKSTWHPRGEYGRPVAIRSAHGPAELADHELVELELELATQPRMHCYIPQPLEPYGDGCASIDLTWMRFEQEPERARPDDARSWAELLGTLDGASAVFESNEMLARCVDGLPPSILSDTATLGMQGAKEALTVTFVERVDPSPELSMLVVVRASMREGESRGITREELWTVDRGVQR